MHNEVYEHAAPSGAAMMAPTPWRDTYTAPSPARDVSALFEPEYHR